MASPALFIKLQMIKEYRTMPLEVITKEVFKQHYQKGEREENPLSNP